MDEIEKMLEIESAKKKKPVIKCTPFGEWIMPDGETVSFKRMQLLISAGTIKGEHYEFDMSSVQNQARLKESFQEYHEFGKWFFFNPKNKYKQPTDQDYINWWNARQKRMGL